MNYAPSYAVIQTALLLLAISYVAETLEYGTHPRRHHWALGKRDNLLGGPRTSPLPPPPPRQGALRDRSPPQLQRPSRRGSQGTLQPPSSVRARAFANILERDALPEGLAYFADRKAGGSPLTITYDPAIDFIHDALGEWKAGAGASTMQIQQPLVKILGAGGAPVRMVRSGVPDFLAVHGRLAPGRDSVVDGASLAVMLRLGPPFKGQLAFVWSVNGEKGEILLTSPSRLYIFSGDSYREPVQIHDP